MGVQKLEEIFNFHIYEISFNIYHSGFGWKVYEKPSNDRGGTSGEIVLIMTRQIEKIQNLFFSY